MALTRIAIVVGLGVGAAVVLAAVLFFLFGHAYRIPASSMEPTLHCARPAAGCEGRFSDRIVVLEHWPWGRGDIVAFHAPRRASADCGIAGTFVKRVVGLGGDRVHEDARGYLVVDGRRLAEPYIHAAQRAEDVAFHNRTWAVPHGSVFLVGDNRGRSCDSRAWGPLPRGKVIGRVMLTYWPPSRITFR